MKKNIKNLILALSFLVVFSGANPALAQESETLSVFVKWGKSVLLNTKADDSGAWYYEIQSQGFAEKNSDQTVFWILEQENLLDPSDKRYTSLGEYPAGTGKKFKLRFPSCDDTGSNCPAVSTSPVKPGYSYRTYFSDSKISPKVINSSRGSGVLNLEKVPSSISNIRDYIQVENIILSKDSNDKNVYNLAVQVLKKENDSLDLALRATRSEDGKELNLKLGALPLSESKSYNISSPASEGDYKRFFVVVSRRGKQIAEIPVALQTVYQDTGADFELNTNLGNQSLQAEIKQDGLVAKNCGYDIGPGGNGHMCGIDDFIHLIQRLIEYIFILLLPIIAIIFVYVGYLYMTSQGDSGKKTAAKNAILNTIKGVVLIMAAWLVVRTILVSLGVTDEFLIFFAK